MLRDRAKDWVHDEATDPRKLHMGGTFSNVLAHKVDEIIAPILGYIISTIDVNNNLDLVISKEDLVRRLWLEIFRDEHALPISYEDTTVSRTSRMYTKSLSEFRCRFPFSSVIKCTADEVLSNAKRIPGSYVYCVINTLFLLIIIIIKFLGDDDTNLAASYTELIRQTRIGTILDSYSEADSVILSHYYLQDFVRMVHQRTANASTEDVEIEYEVL